MKTKNQKPLLFSCAICETKHPEEEAEMLEDGRKVCEDCEEQYTYGGDEE